MKVSVDKDVCVGSGECEATCPAVFEVVDGKSRVKASACSPVIRQAVGFQSAGLLLVTVTDRIGTDSSGSQRQATSEARSVAIFGDSSRLAPSRPLE